MKRFLIYTFFLLMAMMAVAQPLRYHRFDNLDGLTRHLCVRSMAQSEDGMMWLGAEDGLYSFDGQHLQKRESISQNTKTKADKVGCIRSIVARGDSLLVGSERGMWAFDLHTYTFHRLAAQPKEDAELKRLHALLPDEPMVTCYVPTGTGKEGLWIGTPRRVVEWNHESRSVVYEVEVPVAKCLWVDKGGNLLVGTDGGLYVVEPSRKVHHLTHDARMETSLAGDAVWSIFGDKDGNIWLGTNSGVSVAAAGERLVVYGLPSITSEGIGNQIFAIIRDKQRRLWMGGSNGLLCVERLGQEGQACRWYRMNDPRWPLSHNRVRAILADNQGRVWVGGDGGLMLLDETTKQLERYIIREDDKNWVYDIEETADGELMVTTFEGTYLTQPDMASRTMTVRRKLEHRGIDTQKRKRKALLDKYGIAGEGYLSAYQEEGSDTLWLGGTDALATMVVGRSPQDRSADIRITDIMVNRSRLVPHSDLASGTLTFEPDDKVLQFFFSDFDYAHTLPDRFVYTLKNGSEELTIHTGESSIQLTNLAPGTYQLCIRHEGTPDTLASQATQPLRPDAGWVSFTIRVPWYATTLAKVIYVLLALAFVGGIFLIVNGRRRLRRERAERTTLLAQAKEKERQLLSDNEYLAAQLRMQLIEKSGEAGELSADEKFLLDITRLIEQNMDDSELNVDTLSQKSGISAKQLYRRIKAITGMTTVAYIRDQRLKKAASLLAKGSFTVSEVMYRVGFSSASYFTRCFCKEYGVPPSEYHES